MLPLYAHYLRYLYTIIARFRLYYDARDSAAQILRAIFSAMFTAYTLAR